MLVEPGAPLTSAPGPSENGAAVTPVPVGEVEPEPALGSRQEVVDDAVASGANDGAAKNGAPNDRPEHGNGAVRTGVFYDWAGGPAEPPPNDIAGEPGDGAAGPEVPSGPASFGALQYGAPDQHGWDPVSPQRALAREQDHQPEGADEGGDAASERPSWVSWGSSFETVFEPAPELTAPAVPDATGPDYGGPVNFAAGSGVAGSEAHSGGSQGTPDLGMFSSLAGPPERPSEPTFGSSRTEELATANAVASSSAIGSGSWSSPRQHDAVPASADPQPTPLAGPAARGSEYCGCAPQADQTRAGRLVARRGRLSSATHPHVHHEQPTGAQRGVVAVPVCHHQREPSREGALRMTSTGTLSADVKNFNWLLDNFVESSAGVHDAVAVSSDGLLMAMSQTVDRAGAERLAAIISGIVGLSKGAAKAFGWEPVHQVVIAMEGGYLFVSSISSGSNLGVVADAGCDIGLVGYQTNLLLEKIGTLLTPALIAELRARVLDQ